MKKLLLALILLVGNLISAQTIVKYKMPDGQVFSKEVFNVFSKSFEKQNLEYKVFDSTMVDNTLTRIIDIKSSGYFKARQNNENFDPYAKFKENIGLKFKISEFSNNEGKKLSENELVGKPTIINFWFTSCTPCIAELPYLHTLKSKFGNKLNYLAITFDSQAKVDIFLKKTNFDFLHITNSREQIKDLGISGYPMTYILDDKGKIYEIYGGLSDFEYDEIYEMINKKLL
jgi:cytochrome c biogenesis protein CcmG/thiol:disulfide interchange protein DsbE